MKFSRNTSINRTARALPDQETCSNQSQIIIWQKVIIPHTNTHMQVIKLSLFTPLLAHTW